MPFLEIEYKTLLTKDEYNRLSTFFQHVKPITQTNYYFDSSDFTLKAHRMSLRIRTFKNKAELTLKIPEEVGNLEYNQDLTLEQAKMIIKGSPLPEGRIKQILLEETINISSLHVLGNLTTIRRESQTKIGLMALDYNQYADIKDYELELEVTDPEQGKRDFDNFLSEHGIDFKFAKSKVARFATTLKK
ncbi:CYTH domain-containing protein [Streptococcus caprae]|uniref:CYTH domain-containing protein n=1 Tax=Streptococcus caprae TaxID=1640501 RepID=A0ABV8CYC1_9STRE